jgi:hypothetical protein
MRKNPRTKNPLLEPEEVAALRAYAKEHGRYWKSHLREAWMTASEPGILQQLRNASYFGPTGLIKFKLNRLDLVVDGTNKDNYMFEGADETSRPPFVVFDVDLQENIAGPFDTMAEAEKARKEILAGAEPKLDEKKLGAWIDKLDAELDD